jgi:hypothetical protein
MLSFTLDSNCIIALENEEPEAAAIRQLATAHAEGVADVAIAAIMASENQKSVRLLNQFAVFETRLHQVGLGHLSLCHPMLLLDMGFWEHGLWTGPKEEELSETLHAILFPSIEPKYRQFCTARGIPEAPLVWDDDRNLWRNAVCDVQAIWSHIYAKRQVFVSKDGNFHAATKKARLLALGAGRIERPNDAAALLATL